LCSARRRDHFGDVGAAKLAARRDLPAGPEKIAGRHATGLGRPRTWREGGIEDIDVHSEEDRAGPEAAERVLDDRLDPALADVVHEEAPDPALALPRELLLPWPVAPQPDLRISLRVDEPCLDELVHRRPVRELDAEDLGPGIRVRVEVDEADLAALGARANIGLGDRVVAAE